MPERTAQKPHAISCIKDSVYDLLCEKCGHDLTVSCDRDDCWDDRELFKHRQAINIVTRNDVVGNAVKRARGSGKLQDAGKELENCFHDAFLNVDIQIYVEQCNSDDYVCLDGKSKAYSILAHVTSCMTSFQHQILGRRVLYQGSNVLRNSEGELDLIVVTANFQIHYLFDSTRPWVVG